MDSQIFQTHLALAKPVFLNNLSHPLKFEGMNLNLLLVKTGLDLYKLKPINEKVLLKVLKKFNKIVVIDENTFSGGISAVT